MLDTRKEIEIPEGITLDLPVAGLIPRAQAFIIDLIIRYIAVWILAAIFSFMGNFGFGLIMLMLFIIEWFYPVLFEVFSKGQTPGKKALGIAVVNDDGSPVGWSSSIVRNLLRAADFMPFMYGFGIVSMMFNRDFKRLGDLAAGTMVIHTEKKKKKKKKTEAKLLDQYRPLAPKTNLTLEDQHAIINFVERSELLSTSRLNELADYLSPWMSNTKGKNPPQSDLSPATQKLFKMAAWLRGGQ
ncbi:MAG: RDD family protein [Gammaproteobacteria bacterium]|nr:RDD family protein [Gammaproteobacteria bacterium]